MTRMLDRLSMKVTEKVESLGFTIVFFPTAYANQLLESGLLRRDESGRVWIDVDRIVRDAEEAAAQ